MLKNMKKLTFFVAAFALVVFAVPAFAAPEAKVNVCHVQGNGSYNVINVSLNAVPAHLAHGDSLVEIMVNSAVLNYGSTGWGGWSCPEGTYVVDCEATQAGDGSPATVASTTLWEPGASVGAVDYPDTPFGYTYTPPETGCIVQNDDDNGEAIIIVLTCVNDCPIVVNGCAN